jgi:subtilisin family serine protease
MKKFITYFAMLTLLVGLFPMSRAQAIGAWASQDGTEQEFVVVYERGASLEAARAAILAAGGEIVKENDRVGIATIRTTNPDFIAMAEQQAALFGVARNAKIGQAPDDRPKHREDVERLEEERQKSKEAGVQSLNEEQGRENRKYVEPLAHLQWNMAMIHATANGSYAEQQGSQKVLVGVMDTGIDGSHPDIAPNFNAELSRNFTMDIPEVDGPCEEEPDQSCDDPSDVDENGHGTHVAGIIAAPINRLGVSGVAPGVTLVNLRAGQDSGYFFLQPTVDALTYAGDNGVDVVNMSFYIDPWLYNCSNNPADSPEAQQEQRTIIEATQRALDYARAHGVTLISSLGNEHTDLGNPTFDASSPDFPPDTAYPRTVDNTCLDMPTEGNGVIGVSSVGPSGLKSDFSNYGVEQNDVAAPGGYYRDFFDTPQYMTVANLILSAYPESLAIANGELNPDGTPNNPFVVRDCHRDVCAYYQYLQGTSMAAPHAVGVAALIVSEYGKADRLHPNGLTLRPDRTERILLQSATNTACPEPPLFDYPDRPDSFTALCEGNLEFNGFYGNGIVDALRAVDR